LKKDDVGRSHAVADVLKYVRLPLLAPQYLTDKVAKESLIHNSLPCRLTASFVVNSQQTTFYCGVVILVTKLQDTVISEVRMVISEVRVSLCVKSCSNHSTRFVYGDSF